MITKDGVARHYSVRSQILTTYVITGSQGSIILCKGHPPQSLVGALPKIFHGIRNHVQGKAKFGYLVENHFRNIRWKKAGLV